MKLRQLKKLAKKHKVLLIRAGVGLVGVLLLVQIFYPGDRLLPFETVENVRVGGWSKTDAIAKLDDIGENLKIAVRVTGDDKVYKSVKPSEFGLTIKNQARVDAMGYPWWLRVVPTSLLWASAMTSYEAPVYERSDDKLKAYVAKTFGKDCLVQPVNAQVVPKENNLTVIPAEDGGRCKTEDIIEDFKSTEPEITGSHAVAVDVEPIPADISTDMATKFRDTLARRIENGVKVNTLGEEVAIPANEVVKWIRTSPANKQLTINIDQASSDAYFDGTLAKKVAIAPGTTYVTTRDFAEISRKDGAPGRALDRNTTRASIMRVLNGEAKTAAAATMSVVPNVQYTYTYTKSKRGIAALMKNYDTEHDGVFGVSMIELNGSGVAQWQSDKVFTTASTYKLFVAYGTLRKVEAGQWHWSDANIYGGRNLEQCFDYMIVNSNNECAETLLKKLGFSWLTNELKAIGMAKSSFLNDKPETTAGDLALFLTKLQRGDLAVSKAGRERLLSAMSRQVYRQGIPAGASGRVADKVGFLEGLLHDAAIVYSPKGTYILVIMTDGSTWGAIADLTRKIEELR